MRYYVERRKGVSTGSAWWNVAGTAFHETVREWETRAAGDVIPSADDAAERFPHHLANAIADEILQRGVPMSEWRAGGRESKEYPNKEDRVWWLDKGPEMVAKYVLAQQGRESEVLRLADGETLALELGFLYRMDDSDAELPPPRGFGELPPLKGFIDQVLYFPRTDAVLIRDYKSGSRVPVDTLQLKVYRLALESCFGITASKWWGDYWHARKGVATKGLDLTDRAKIEREVRYRLDVMDTAETLGLYASNPGDSCSSCGVRPHCPAMSDEPFALWPQHGAPSAPALDSPRAGA